HHPAADEAAGHHGGRERKSQCSAHEPSSLFVVEGRDAGETVLFPGRGRIRGPADVIDLFQMSVE
ncbi:hypothetical protein, partial [Methylobacterium goesingense]|uniref:hypothetical protein n=1 Tax=Methylobacterium goesingense TaxID=243690 RepID=UPI0036362325